MLPDAVESLPNTEPPLMARHFLPIVTDHDLCVVLSRNTGSYLSHNSLVVDGNNDRPVDSWTVIVSVGTAPLTDHAVHTTVVGCRYGGVMQLPINIFSFRILAHHFSFLFVYLYVGPSLIGRLVNPLVYLPVSLSLFLFVSLWCLPP